MRLLTLQSFRNTSLDLFEAFGCFPLQCRFTIGIILASRAVVRQRQLVVARGAIGRQFLVFFQWRNGFGKLLLSDQGRTQTQVGLSKTGIDLYSPCVVLDRFGEVVFVL